MKIHITENYSITSLDKEMRSLYRSKWDIAQTLVLEHLSRSRICFHLLLELIYAAVFRINSGEISKIKLETY